MEQVVVFEDPLHEYAARFIDVFHRRHGLRSVCLFTDRRRRAHEERAFPTLRSPAVAARWDVEGEPPHAVADRLRARYGVAAVVPYSEERVLGAAELGERLGVAWNEPAVLRRFRDKYAMKAHLRAVAPGLRVNASWPVRSVDEVLARARAFPRYVLKPNAGWGNRGVAVFDATTPRSAIEDYFRRTGPAPIVAEEWIGGRELFVNGQADGRGEPHVLAVFAYERVAANGRADLDHRTRLLPRDDPDFALAAEYARRVVRAAGLVRSPFHLEAKIDDAGPCLIEVGARLAGHGNALVCSRVHGDALDLFDVAAHYYLTADDHGAMPRSWARYDAARVRYVHGLAPSGAHVVSGAAIAAAEALPSFMAWARRPMPGRAPRPTVDALSMPWSLVLSARSEAELDRDEARARRILAEPGAPWAPVVARARSVVERASGEVRWRIARAGGEAAIERARGAVVRAARLATSKRDVVRKLQEAGIARGEVGSLDVLSPSRVEVAARMLAWAREYLTRPHPELGRRGPVCPFAAKTLAADRFTVAVHDEVTGDEAQMRGLVLAHADAFRRRFPVERYDASASLLIVVPNVPEEAFARMDAVHDDTKTFLMRARMMVTAIHPRSTRPALWNPRFHVLRAPIPCFALRHMVIQDITFVGHNLEAMRTYVSLFGDAFARGKVSNELGHVDLFEAACARFGLAGRVKG